MAPEYFSARAPMTFFSTAASIFKGVRLARAMAGAGEARSTGPVAMKAFADATQVASTARGYAIEYIFAGSAERL